jgi:hypothetical protein
MKAWAKTVVVNPDRLVPLAGFESRNQVFSKVADDLEINVCVLEGADRTVALLTFDSLSVGQKVSEHAEKAFGKFGAAAVSVASHSHFAPALDERLPNLGIVDETYSTKICEVIDQLAMSYALEGTTPVEIFQGHSSKNFGINRRKKALGPGFRYGTQRLPNPHGNSGDGLSAIDVRTLQGETIAKFWRCSCHPVSFYNSTEVSADFVGVVRRKMRISKPSIPVLFFQGFSGDIRPPSVSKDRSLLSHVRRLLQGDFFGEMSEEEWRNWANAIADTVESCICNEPVTGDNLTVRTTELPLAMLQGGPAERFGDRPGLEITSVRLGTNLQFVFLSAEPVAEWSAQFPRTDGVTTWHIGYASHVFGYLPTARMLREGGYEVDGFRPAFSLPGQYVDDIDKIIREAFNRVCEDLTTIQSRSS